MCRDKIINVKYIKCCSDECEKEHIKYIMIRYIKFKPIWFKKNIFGLLGYKPRHEFVTLVTDDDNFYVLNLTDEYLNDNIFLAKFRNIGHSVSYAGGNIHYKCVDYKGGYTCYTSKYIMNPNINFKDVEKFVKIYGSNNCSVINNCQNFTKRFCEYLKTFADGDTKIFGPKKKPPQHTF